MKTNRSVARFGLIALFSLTGSAFSDAPSYKMDKSFGKDEMKSPPICISMDNKDQLYVLLEDGTVALYNTDGKNTGSFKTDMKPAPSTMTVADGKIYLLNSKVEMKTVEQRGKKVRIQEPVGVQCFVYDAAGAKQSEIKIPDVLSAKDAHFIGKELAIGSFGQQSIFFFEVTGTEAKMTRKLDKIFRLCCGIFDFCPGTEPNSMIVANLGAFKVQTFVDAKKSSEFGARGEKENEFHGCCNPVNVAVLADGSIVTVEKDPTRVKIYDKEGKNAKKVGGVAELVAGCCEIPVTVDSKGSLYLASGEKKCIVKCVPGVVDPAIEEKEAKHEKEAAEAEAKGQDAEPPEMLDLQKKVMGFLHDKQYDKANDEVKSYIKSHPDLKAEDKCGMTLGVGMAQYMENGDAKGADKLLDDVIAAYPDTELAKHKDEAKASIKEQFEQLKAQKEEEKSEKPDAPAAPAAPAEKQ